jgi:hypothetical protein
MSAIAAADVLAHGLHPPVVGGAWLLVGIVLIVCFSFSLSDRSLAVLIIGQSSIPINRQL